MFKGLSPSEEKDVMSSMERKFYRGHVSVIEFRLIVYLLGHPTQTNQYQQFETQRGRNISTMMSLTKKPLHRQVQKLK